MSQLVRWSKSFGQRGLLSGVRAIVTAADLPDAGGYLFVGHSESLYGLSSDFELVHFPDATAYRKPAPVDQRRSQWTPIA